MSREINLETIVFVRNFRKLEPNDLSMANESNDHATGFAKHRTPNRAMLCLYGGVPEHAQITPKLR